MEKPSLAKPIYECSKCPSGADCPGGSILDVNPGYWRINDQSSVILPCSNAPQNCLGGTTNSTCATGHIGSLCESCDIEKDYSITGDFQCGSCGNQAINAFKIIGIFICFVSSLLPNFPYLQLHFLLPFRSSARNSVSTASSESYSTIIKSANT